MQGAAGEGADPAARGGRTESRHGGGTTCQVTLHLTSLIQLMSVTCFYLLSIQYQAVIVVPLWLSSIW